MDTEAQQTLNRYQSSRPRRLETDQRSKRNHQLSQPLSQKGYPEVIVMELQSFDETPQALQALRERKMVILVLSQLTSEQAQRAADFVAGGTYAVDGHTEWIGEQTFLFAPRCFQLTPTGKTFHSVAPSLA